MELPECTHQDRCLNRDGIKINWESHKSLNNWVERFNLECKFLKSFELIGESPILIGMIGSSMFAGWMAGSLFMPRLGDLYGRKWPFYLSLLVASVTYFSVLLTTDIKVQILNFFIMGVTQAGRYSMAHVYLQELMPVTWRTFAGTLA